jgi:hypothetical protein
MARVPRLLPIAGTLAAVEAGDTTEFWSTNPGLMSVALATAPPVSRVAKATVDLSAADSNDVEITNPTPSNPITITSLGTGVPWVRVHVKFMDPNITVNIPAVPTKLYHPGDISIFRALVDGSWVEESIVSPVGSAAATQYTTSQTITIRTPRAKVRMWGGSGASGAGSSPNFYNSNSGSPGTGAGGYLEKFLTGLTVGNTLAFTCGNPGAATTGIGGNGTASILASGTQTIATLTANGSNGSQAGNVAGSAGGTATGGDLNQTGQTGGNAPPIYDTPSGPGTAITVVGYYSGIGGRNGLANGVDGVYVSPGNHGNPGGLIIEWVA